MRVAITEQFVNCPRYIVKHARVAPSPYVPDDNGNAPTATWKKIDGMSAVLPPVDAERVDTEGEQISIAEYEARRLSGTA